MYNVLSPYRIPPGVTDDQYVKCTNNGLENVLSIGGTVEWKDGNDSFTLKPNGYDIDFKYYE